MKVILSILLALCLILGFVGTFAFSQTEGVQHYESYFLYLGNFPYENETVWSEDVQGITTDGNYWFITQQRELWKIPITQDLRSVSVSDPGVVYRHKNEFPALDDYNHMGDLDFYEYEGEGYLVIPLEGGEIPAIAVFSAYNLEYVDHAELYATSGVRIPWCAVDPDGHLHMSNSDTVTTHYEYGIDWAAIADQGELLVEIMGEYPFFLPFLDESGAPLELTVIQGGEFSESGDLLYVVAGYDKHRPNDGINVFNTQTWRRVRRSTDGSMPFNYEFDPASVFGQEPEGLAIWDMDHGRAPGISGSLHVLLLENETTDDVYLKHYTEVINVDGSHVGDEEGTPNKPFNTVGEAYDLAWDGQRIKIQAGSYPETLTFSKRIEVLATGGTVVIGE